MNILEALSEGLGMNILEALSRGGPGYEYPGGPL